MEKESDIIFENGPFFAILCRGKIEIRKNMPAGGALLLGIAPNRAIAKRFINRAVLHPERF